MMRTSTNNMLRFRGVSLKGGGEQGHKPIVFAIFMWIEILAQGWFYFCSFFN